VKAAEAASSLRFIFGPYPSDTASSPLRRALLHSPRIPCKHRCQGTAAGMLPHSWQCVSNQAAALAGMV